MKYRRNIYITCITIVIYFIIAFCYNKLILKDEYNYVYLLNKDVSRGEIIKETDLEKIKISKVNEDIFFKELEKEMFYTDNYVKGSIVLKTMSLSKDEYIKVSEDKEIVSIKLNSSDDAASYQIKKGNKINVFYSAKQNDLLDIINSIEKASIISSNNGNGYITFKLLEKVSIVNCYDKNGNVSGNTNITETILVEVSKDESIKINNLKNYGKFSISIVK